MNLTDEQQSFVNLVMSSPRPRLVCLTGGPGTGKTTTLRALLAELRQRGETFAVAAPSGKAAQRCEEALQGIAKASTLHRLLRLRPDGGEVPAPVFASVVVVDEASMIDVHLFAALMRACFEGGGRVGCLVLVGDPDQLPPVGPGQPFLDLLASTTLPVPVVRLTQVHRQALDSGIVRAAYAIKAGREPEWCADFRLVPCDAAAEVPGRVVQVMRELELHPAQSQVLAPQRTTTAGVEALNAHVEGLRASHGPLLRERFRVGSKVIVTKNDYDLAVFNGEVGFVVEAKLGAKPGQDTVAVDLGRGDGPRVVPFRGAAISWLDPAWALTVHRTQGSEYEDVILVAHTAHSYMLSRSLLYVACTRARRRVVVVGQREAVARAVRKADDVRRATLLQRWLGSRRSA